MSRRIALLIGVRHFDDRRFHPLNAPDGDVLALQSVLRDPAIGRFDSVELCLNEPYDSVREKVVALTRERQPDDLILLYYSGHGVQDFDGALHLLTRNSNYDRLEAASFHSDEIRGFLNRSHSRRQLLILDCCYAGAFVGEGYKDAGIMRPAITEATFDTRGYGRVVMMASAATQPAPDGIPSANSVSPFTRFLVEGLRDGLAAPDDEEITAQALASYAETRTRREMPGLTPRILRDEQAGAIVMARNPHAGVTRIPTELRDALSDPDPLRRGGAVARLAAMLDAEDASRAHAVRRLLEVRLRDERDADLRDALRGILGLAPGVSATLEALRRRLDETERELRDVKRIAAEEERRLSEARSRSEAIERSRDEAITTLGVVQHRLTQVEAERDRAVETAMTAEQLRHRLEEAERAASAAQARLEAFTSERNIELEAANSEVERARQVAAAKEHQANELQMRIETLEQAGDDKQQERNKVAHAQAELNRALEQGRAAETTAAALKRRLHELEDLARAAASRAEKAEANAELYEAALVVARREANRLAQTKATQDQAIQSKETKAESVEGTKLQPEDDEESNRQEAIPKTDSYTKQKQYHSETQHQNDDAATLRFVINAAMSIMALALTMWACSNLSKPSYTSLSAPPSTSTPAPR